MLHPNVKVIGVEPTGAASMKASVEAGHVVTLENICACLENESPEIVLDDEVRRAAERSILNMINVK